MELHNTPKQPTNRALFGASSLSATETCGELLWQELVRRHEPSLKRRLRGSLAKLGMREPEDQIEEMSQEVFRRLLSHHGKTLCEGPARCELTLAAYLGRAAESTVIDRLRYRFAAKRDFRCLRSLSHPAIAEEALRFPDPRSDPEQRAIQRQAVRILLSRLRSYNAHMRASAS